MIKYAAKVRLAAFPKFSGIRLHKLLQKFSEINGLQQLQNRAARIVANCGFDTANDQLMKILVYKATK